MKTFAVISALIYYLTIFSPKFNDFRELRTHQNGSHIFAKMEAFGFHQILQVFLILQECWPKVNNNFADFSQRKHYTD